MGTLCEASSISQQIPHPIFKGKRCTQPQGVKWCMCVCACLCVTQRGTGGEAKNPQV